jgi:hypothetical protein
LVNEVDLFEVKEVEQAKMAIANQPTAADTVQTIEKLEDELNGIGNYDLMDSGKKPEERKIPLHL